MTQEHSRPQDLRLGLAYWMQRVLEELDKAGLELTPDSVHDLRVAIRRCRSIGEALQSLDPDRNWKRMRKAGQAVFSRLGELRDVQVLLEWVQKLGSARDETTVALRDLLRWREQELQAEAVSALQGFDSRQWKTWIAVLSERAARIAVGGLVFEYLALEAWERAHALHRKALRNRSQVAIHQLRIGIKKFRYLVENFLPVWHRQWGSDLKELQDLLGEVHDLDVLWGTARSSGVFTDPVERTRWQKKVAEERQQRIVAYRNKMVGPGSPWPIWRAALPGGERLQEAVLAKLKVWASFLDPDPEHARRVAELALQLYDGLVATHLLNPHGGDYRLQLQAAAWMHEVGRARTDKAYHKASARLIRKIGPPLGWTAEELETTALIARYHRGALPLPRHKAWRRLSAERQLAVRQLAGILRLAESLDAFHEGKIHRLRVQRTPETLVLYADGYTRDSALGEKTAAARYLLETAIDLPIVLRSVRAARLQPAAPRTTREDMAS